MNFDPATCIHCDPVGESTTLVLALWILWLIPGVLFLVRRAIQGTGWASHACRVFATAGALTGTTVAGLLSLIWVFLGR